MKKNLSLMVLLLVSLAACRYDYTVNNGAAQAVAHPVLLEQYESPGVLQALQAAVIFSNEFGVGFLLRNETGSRLYYNDDFRVDSIQMSNVHNRWGVQFINHGNTQKMHVNWSASRPTGIYVFERDFFLDESLTELYTTLTIEFDVIGWYHFTEGAEPIPEDLQAKRDARIRNSLEFQIAEGTSKIIVLASEVAVSRTEAAFRTANLSTQPFIHGLDYRLLVYENGWMPAPTIVDEWAVPSIGFFMQGGEVIDDRFNFEWLHGALPNGRYMIKRQHAEDHGRPGAPRVQETLMVEFIIDDSTPTSLDDVLPTAASLNVYADEITPTGLRLHVTNLTDQAFQYSSPFILQKYVYGMWENIYEIAAVKRVHHEILANSSAAIYETWAERFGKLPPGRYQLTAHFSSRYTGQIASSVFDISLEAFEEYDGGTQLNPMFVQNVVVTEVAVTPSSMTIRWENMSDRTFYTPWTGYWIASYSPKTGRDWNRLREAFDSEFIGPYANLRLVTVEMTGGGTMTFYTTAIHPGEHVYQIINWTGELPIGQYVISLGHFNPDEPGFMYWITPWERFVLRFDIE